jgi:hypothetical protein
MDEQTFPLVCMDEIELSQAVNQFTHLYQLCLKWQCVITAVTGVLNSKNMIHVGALLNTHEIY